jgi:L-alanine-DL-glutamate epimerase-like enolase superfamily enzyme
MRNSYIMDIHSAEVHRLRIPLNRTYEISTGTAAEMDVLLVIVTATDGTQGIGTADPVLGHATPQSPDEIYTSLSEQILPELVSDTPTNPNKLRLALDFFEGKENAQCAAEMAYLDCYCRQRDQSLGEFLGGILQDEEPLNGWVGVDSPEIMVAETEQLYDQGFRSIKAKLSGDVELDVARVEALCKAFGEGMQIRLDANEGYSDVDTAIEAAQKMEGYSLAHLEQPISREDFDGLAQITAATSLVVMADEPIMHAADGYQYLKANAADRLKFKILKSGGVMMVRRGLDMAAAAGVSCVVGHGFCSAPAACAELQLIATHENVFRPVETVGTLKMMDEPFTHRPDMSDGTVKVPDGPGIGTELDDEALDDFSVEVTVIE